MAVRIETGRIKYIVAREGLIIIALLTGSGLSFYANSWQAADIREYVNGAKEVELVTYVGILDKFEADYRDNPFAKYAAPPANAMLAYINSGSVVQGINAQFPSSTHKEVIKSTMDRDFIAKMGKDRPKFYRWVRRDGNPTRGTVTRYDDKGNRLFTGLVWDIDFEKAMTFFLFIAYPAYLLARFVVWAIAIIRTQRTATD